MIIEVTGAVSNQGNVSGWTSYGNSGGNDFLIVYAVDGMMVIIYGAINNSTVNKRCAGM